jgi:hypothetical protein
MRSDGVLTFIVNEYGKPFASGAAYGNRFADWCDQAGLTSVLCDDGRTRNYRAHGLRKAAKRAAAHAGCTGVELMALGGHSSLKQVQEYVDEADQERAAEAVTTKLATARETKRQQTVAKDPGWWWLKDPQLIEIMKGFFEWRSQQVTHKLTTSTACKKVVTKKAL